MINGIMCYCPTKDIEGNPRPDPAGSMPDIGAYESQLAVAGVKENKFIIPTEFSLEQNFPNPFNSATAIRYSIPQRSNVTLIIYDILGNEVITLVNEEKEQGVYTINFDANNLASEVYFYQLRADNYIETKKMLLLK
jgi:hypothetical protein